MADSYDVVVIGGGPGGVAAAIRAKQLGAEVALIEDGQWGGLCLNLACVPTKLLARAADAALALQQGQVSGLEAPNVSLDFGKLMAQRQELVGYLSMGTKGLAGSNKMKLIEGRGKLAGPNTVVCGDQTLTAKSIIVATGMDWDKPAVPGADLPGLINSSEFQFLDDAPKRTLILGGEPWGLELAQVLIAAGGEATVAEPAKSILPDEDDEIRQRMRTLLNQPGMTLLYSAELASLSRAGSAYEATLTVAGAEQKVTVDQVVYFNRKVNLDGLGLDTVGLTDLSVNEFQETSVKGIYAIGDVTQPFARLSHMSSAQGVVAAENALGAARSINPNAVPRVVYTRPQMGAVGLTEDQAEEAGYDVITGEVPLGVNPMAMIQGQTGGMIKVVGEEKYGELLGVHVVGPNATEIIGQGALAIQMEATLEELARCVFPHPTISESLADAARDALGWAIYLPK